MATEATATNAQAPVTETTSTIQDIGDFLNETLYTESLRETIDHPAVFWLLAGWLLGILIWLIIKILGMTVFKKKRLKVKLEDGTCSVLNAGAIKDLQKIASRDLGTPKSPKIKISQTRKGLVVKAKMQIYENQKGPEMKHKLEASLRREFRDKHGLEILRVDTEFDHVQSGEGPTSDVVTAAAVAAASTLAAAKAGKAAEPVIEDEVASDADKTLGAVTTSELEPAKPFEPHSTTEPESTLTEAAAVKEETDAVVDISQDAPDTPTTSDDPEVTAYEHARAEAEQEALSSGAANYPKAEKAYPVDDPELDKPTEFVPSKVESEEGIEKPEEQIKYAELHDPDVHGDPNEPDEDIREDLGDFGDISLTDEPDAQKAPTDEPKSSNT